MTEEIKTGGPAFPGFQYTEGRGPCRRGLSDEWEVYSPGLSLRDYFAGQALAGLLASPSRENQPAQANNSILGRWSYEIADAMLAAREVKP